MPTRHRVSQGETLVSISDQYGFFVDSIWEASENAELRAKRRTRNALLPGDIVFIPDKRRAVVAAATDRRHSFKRRGIPARLRVQIRVAGEPRANEHFRLALGSSSEEIQGTTDADGVVDVPLPTRVGRVLLWLGDDVHAIALDVGHMDPVEEPSGVAKRLVNLGHLTPGAPVVDDGGGHSKAVVRAIKRFQLAQDLEPTGELDAQTEAALIEVHDTQGARAR